jgi:hypothetical protein
MPEKDPGTDELNEAEEGLRTILSPRDEAAPVVEPHAARQPAHPVVPAECQFSDKPYGWPELVRC